MFKNASIGDFVLVRRLWDIATVTLLLGCSNAPTSSPQASAGARFALGTAAPYPADPQSGQSWTAVQESVQESRALAWRIVKDVVEPVVAESHVNGKVFSFSVPRFLTWYDERDFDRLIVAALTAKDLDAVRNRVPLTTTEWNRAADSDIERVLTLPHWNEVRLESWLADITSDAEAAGLSGLARNLYSPAAASHLGRNYGTTSDCKAIAEQWDPIDTSAFAPCYSTMFPSDAVIVKTTWRRHGFGFKIPVFDTDAGGIDQRLAGHDWGEPSRLLDPESDDIFTMQTSNGAIYRLAGLHIMSKEAQDWIWISLWWSDDPHTDFGADRPALNSAFDNYKMCVVTGFEAPLPDEELIRNVPDLAAALIATQAHVGQESWCSNPHFEQGPSNQTSNCIGCHQYGGMDLDQEEMLTTPASYSAGVRQKQRHNFPADYLWSVTKEPENLSHSIAERWRQVVD